MRPDLNASALKGEPDIEPATLSQGLQEQANEAKQFKDNKDVEKLGEADLTI